MAQAMAYPFDCAAASSSYHQAEFRLEDLMAAKGSRTVVVCIPARDEEATITSIVSKIRTELAEPSRRRDGRGRHAPGPLVDEILVVDDNSSDRTARLAARAGAVVVDGPGLGKGEAMRLARGRGDFVVYLDGDVLNFSAYYVTGLLGPLLLRPGTVIVKGRYARPVGAQPAQAAAAGADGTVAVSDGAGAVAGGGRVTELVAKPLLLLLYPELAWLGQPLAGETALRADVLDHLELAPAYGVEIGLLIDVLRCHGRDAIAEVELGERFHRNRPLHQLAAQALDVMTAVLTRSVFDNRFPSFSPGAGAPAYEQSVALPSVALEPSVALPSVALEQR